jgi:hypothetical protein
MIRRFAWDICYILYGGWYAAWLDWAGLRLFDTIVCFLFLFAAVERRAGCYAHRYIDWLVVDLFTFDVRAS